MAVTNELLQAVFDAYQRHDRALCEYFAEHGAEHEETAEGDACPEDDTCQCPLVVAMNETERELDEAVRRLRDARDFDSPARK